MELGFATIIGLGLGLLIGFVVARAFNFLEMLAYLLLWILSVFGIFLAAVIIIALIGERSKTRGKPDTKLRGSVSKLLGNFVV